MSIVRSGLLELRGAGLWSTYVPELVVAQTFGGYVFNTVTYHSFRTLPLPYYALVLAPLLVLIGVGAAALRVNRDARILVALCWTVPLVLVIASSLATGRVTAYAFHLNFLQPFLALFLGAGLVSLRAPRFSLSPTVASTAAIVGFAALMITAVQNMQWNANYQSYQYDRAAALVRGLYQNGDAVLYIPRGVSRGFTFYFAPPGRQLGIDVTPAQWTRTAVVDQSRAVASQLTPADRRVWVVFSEPLPRGSGREITTILEQHLYRLASLHDFKGLGVGLFVRPTE